MKDPRIEEIRIRVEELSRLLRAYQEEERTSPLWFRKVWNRTGKRGKWHLVRGINSYGRGYVCGCGTQSGRRYGDVDVDYADEEPDLEDLCAWAKVRPWRPEDGTEEN